MFSNTVLNIVDKVFLSNNASEPTVEGRPGKTGRSGAYISGMVVRQAKGGGADRRCGERSIHIAHILAILHRLMLLASCRNRRAALPRLRRQNMRKNLVRPSRGTRRRTCACASYNRHRVGGTKIYKTSDIRSPWRRI